MGASCNLTEDIGRCHNFSQEESGGGEFCDFLRREKEGKREILGAEETAAEGIHIRMAQRGQKLSNIQSNEQRDLPTP